MHQQIRMIVPGSSPPDVTKPLQILSRAGLSLISIGGGDVENGGELAISVDDDKMDHAKQLLDAQYDGVRIVDVLVCWLEPHGAGQLVSALAQAKRDPRYDGKAVKDVTITTEQDDKGRIAVQVYFEDR
jgi:hypothetical protein